MSVPEDASAGDRLDAVDINTLRNMGFSVDKNAGETINGATLPVAVYMLDSDGEWYSCDGNVLTALNFKGFAISNSTDGNPIQIQTSGIVGGFTGLTKGATYFVQDDKTLGTSLGTYEVKVGIAISTTEILIDTNQTKVFISLESSNASVTGSSGTYDIDIVCGFRPSLIEISGLIDEADITSNVVHDLYWENAQAYGPAYWVNGTYQGWRFDDGSNLMSDITNGLIGYTRDVTGGTFNMTVANVTNTGFSLRITNSQDTDIAYWRFQLKVIG